MSVISFSQRSTVNLNLDTDFNNTIHRHSMQPSAASRKSDDAESVAGGANY